ncbi:MAG: hypothetical protein SFU91_04860 [Chloroherpetonaceae bacterium]|nr:hypothetical protein [Chloroherpetonaceae bacterium]
MKSESIEPQSSAQKSAEKPIAKEGRLRRLVRGRAITILVVTWIAIIVLALLALQFGADTFIVGELVFVFGLVSNAFTGLLGLIALVPLVGPLLVKVLSFPIIWLINGIGYLVSIIAIRRGYSQDVLTYRGLTIAVLVGIAIGYILGKIL